MSLITNFRELKHGTDYIYMMIESSSFDINMSYENLIIGTFDNIYDDGDIDKFIVKNYTDVLGKEGTKISFRRTTPRGLRVFRLPTSNEEYINLVNLIKSYGNGKILNTKSKTIIAAWKMVYHLLIRVVLHINIRVQQMNQKMVKDMDIYKNNIKKIIYYFIYIYIWNQYMKDMVK